MTTSPSPRRSPRNHPASLVLCAIGSIAGNVTNDFAKPSNQNGVLAAVTDIVTNAPVFAAAPSSIINNTCKIFCYR